MTYSPRYQPKCLLPFAQYPPLRNFDPDEHAHPRGFERPRVAFSLRTQRFAYEHDTPRR